MLNLYTGGLAMCNIITRLGRFWTTLIVSAVGVGLSLFPSLVNGYTNQMSLRSPNKTQAGSCNR